jgi:hypothetical protein
MANAEEDGPIMIVIDTELERAEQKIVGAFEAQLTMIAPARIIEILRANGVSDEIARIAIWHLIDRDQLELTKDRMLRLLPSPSHDVDQNGSELNGR